MGRLRSAVFVFLAAATPALGQRFAPPPLPAALAKAGLASQKSVQKELQLSDEQVQKIDRLVQDQRDIFQNVRALGPQAREKKLKESAVAQQEALAKILDKKQQERLQQIWIQQRGPGAAAEPEVADALKLSKEQRDEIQAIRTEALAQSRALAFGRDREKVEAFRKSTAEKFRAVLNADQQAKLQEISGAPFQGEILPPTRRLDGRPDGDRPPRRLDRSRGDRDASSKPATDSKQAVKKEDEKARKPHRRDEHARRNENRREGRESRRFAGADRPHHRRHGRERLVSRDDRGPQEHVRDWRLGDDSSRFDRRPDDDRGPRHFAHPDGDDRRPHWQDLGDFGGFGRGPGRPPGRDFAGRWDHRRFEHGRFQHGPWGRFPSDWRGPDRFDGRRWHAAYGPRERHGGPPYDWRGRPEFGPRPYWGRNDHWGRGRAYASLDRPHHYHPHRFHHGSGPGWRDHRSAGDRYWDSPRGEHRRPPHTHDDGRRRHRGGHATGEGPSRDREMDSPIDASAERSGSFDRFDRDAAELARSLQRIQGDIHW